MTHHRHVHMIVPGGGIAPDASGWVSCRPGFFLPVRVLSRLFRRLFFEMIIIETFERGVTPHQRPSTPDVTTRIDAS